LTIPTLDFTAAWTAINAENAGEESVPEGGAEPAATPGEGEEVLNLNAYNVEWYSGTSIRDALVEAFANNKFLAKGCKIDGTTLNLAIKGQSGTAAFMKMDTTASISLSHTHKPTFTAPSGTSGKVELTIGDADFSKTTSDKASFNVVDTSWFKALAIKVGNTNNSSSAVNVFSLQDANNNVIGSKTFSCTLIENVNAKTVTLTSGGNTIGTVSTADTYAAGWAAAIAHAKAKAYVSGGGSGGYNLTEYKLSAGATLTNTSKKEWSYFKGNVTITGGGAGDIDWSKVSSTPV